MSSMMFEWVQDLDRGILFKLNHEIHSPLIDGIVIFLSGSWPWIIGLVAFLILGVLRKSRELLLLFVWCGVTVGAADAFNHYVLKEFFGRFRPCKELDLVRILDGCAGWLSFPSNHASNAMCLAVMLLGYAQNRWTAAVLALAVSVGVSRIFVGAHYPSDVLAGFAVGAALGHLATWLGKKAFPPVLYNSPDKSKRILGA